MEPFKFDLDSISSTFPLIIFSYLYQVNIPGILQEIRSEDKVQAMSKVIKYGTLTSAAVYIVIGLFGYALFSTNV